MTYAFTSEQLEWLEALESGAYEQGKDCLNKDNKFCCLGVACDILSKKGTVLKTVKENGIVDYDNLSTILSEEVIDLLKLNGSTGGFWNIRDEFPHLSLASANDGGKTFLEIAAFIRKNPDVVFSDAREVQ